MSIVGLFSALSAFELAANSEARRERVPRALLFLCPFQMAGTKAPLIWDCCLSAASVFVLSVPPLFSYSRSGGQRQEGAGRGGEVGCSHLQEKHLDEISCLWEEGLEGAGGREIMRMCTFTKQNGICK